MNNIFRTPKTLDEVVIMLCLTPGGPDRRDRMHAVIKDFIAQKFSVAYMNAGTDNAKLKELSDLFEQLTKKDIV